MPLCISETSKKDLVPRALIEAEILTSPLPHVFAQLGPFLGADALPMGVLTPPKRSKCVHVCLRNLKKILVHGALIDAEILTSPLPHVFVQLGPFWGANALPMDVSTLSSGLKVFLCVSGTSKNVGAWGPNRC